MKGRLILLGFLMMGSLLAKAQKEIPVGKALDAKIAELDSTVFAAFNGRDIEKFAAFFDKGLEFFHDKGGLTDYNHTVTALKNVADSKTDLKRTLVKNSLEVFPIPGYGAMQLGSHTFCHTENNKPDCGTFRFAHVWQYKEGAWKITRVLSFDH